MSTQEVLEERQRFDQLLPTLLKSELAGRYVVFRKGKFVSDHNTQKEAYRAGLQAFGPTGGHLVTQVAPMRIVRLSAI